MNMQANLTSIHADVSILGNIYVTKNYDLFSSIDGNRDVNPLHIKRLKDSFTKKQLINPIIINEKYQIIDGQHRFNAAKALDLNVFFIICKGYGISDVQLLNTHARNWGKLDYLDAYCKTGMQPYLDFKKFMIDYPVFGIASAEVLLTQSLGGKRNYNVKDIKEAGLSKGFAVKYFEEGDLSIPDLSYSYKCAERLLEIAPYYNGFNRPTFVRAMLGIFRLECYDHNKMIARIKANPAALVHCSNVTQYKDLLEEVYNFRSRTKVSLRF